MKLPVFDSHNEMVAENPIGEADTHREALDMLKLHYANTGWSHTPNPVLINRECWVDEAKAIFDH